LLKQKKIFIQILQFPGNDSNQVTNRNYAPVMSFAKRKEVTPSFEKERKKNLFRGRVGRSYIFATGKNRYAISMGRNEETIKRSCN